MASTLPDARQSYQVGRYVFHHCRWHNYLSGNAKEPKQPVSDSGAQGLPTSTAEQRPIPLHPKEEGRGLSSLVSAPLFEIYALD
jgi:hypothetical protein